MNIMKIIRNIRGLIMPASVVAALLCFAAAVNNMDSDRAKQGVSQLEEAIRRSCAAYYSSEGVYPPDLESLKEKFGIQIDENYMVDYRIFADNLMPDITVLENKR